MRGYSPMRWTSQETAAAFRTFYERRKLLPRGGRLAQPPVPTAGCAEFRAIVLDKVHRLTPKWTKQIHQDVEDDFGTTSYDRVRRTLKRLTKDGAIVRTEDGYLRAARRWR